MKPKSSAIHAFGLVHFAGIVEYNINGFLEKNRDTFSDLMQLVQTSNNKFLTSLFFTDMQIVSYKCEVVMLNKIIFIKV